MRYVLVNGMEVIAKRFHAKPGKLLVEMNKSYSINSGNNSYVIIESNVIEVFKYGLTPFFASEIENLVTARVEGEKNKTDDPGYKGSKAIFLQPEFRKPLFSQRCIVIADAYYVLSQDNLYYLIYLKNKCRPFGFAGIYDTWKDPVTKEEVTTFAIITTTANTMLQRVGVKRMPVILPFLYETNWVKSTLHLSEILSYLEPYPSDKMNAYQVSDRIVMDGVNDASLVQPIGEKLQEEDKPLSAVRRYHYHKTKPVSNTPWFKSDDTL